MVRVEDFGRNGVEQGIHQVSLNGFVGYYKVNSTIPTKVKGSREKEERDGNKVSRERTLFQSTIAAFRLSYIRKHIPFYRHEYPARLESRQVEILEPKNL